MRRSSRWIYFAMCALAFGLLRADIDKPRSEEAEGKPEPEMGKPGGPGKVQDEADHEAIHQKLAAEGEATLKEIARLMEKVQNNLSRKDTGEPTQSDQGEVVKKIQELIDKLENERNKGG